VVFVVVVVVGVVGVDVVVVAEVSMGCGVSWFASQCVPSQN